MTALVVILCGILTLATLMYIFFEDVQDVGRARDRRAVLQEKKEQLLENLRDLRFEYRAGKLSEADYEQTRTTLEGGDRGCDAGVGEARARRTPRVRRERG